MANHLIRSVSGLAFQDLGCSLKAFRTEVLRKIRLYGEMHRFIPAWMATVTSPDRMAEVAVSHFPRTKGESKYGLSRTLRVLVDLLSIHFFLRFGTRLVKQWTLPTKTHCSTLCTQVAWGACVFPTNSACAGGGGGGGGDSCWGKVRAGVAGSASGCI
jgi:hypothetical protein